LQLIIEETLKEFFIILTLTMILGLLIYSRTKAFRFGRAKRLDNSNEFQKLIIMGFQPRIIDTFNVYLGKFKGFHFLVYIAYSDYYFNTDS